MLLRAITALTLATSAIAGTFTVDDDGGADFTEIRDAIAAASNGDLILVAPGSYQDFTLGKGLVIMGTAPGVQVSSGSRVSSLAGNRRAVMADMSFTDLQVVNCNGAVVLDNLTVAGAAPSDYVNVSGSNDVRFHELVVSATSGSRAGIFVSGSRSELVDCDVEGDAGSGDGANGSPGISLGNFSFAHVAGSSVRGGNGADGNFATCFSFSAVPGGDGGEAIWIGSSSEGLITGIDTDLIKGGDGGIGDKCACDGSGGFGAYVTSSGTTTPSSLRYSGATLEGGGTYCYGDASPVVVDGFCGGCTSEDAVPADPYLTKQFVPAPGDPLRFVVYGEPGDLATLYLGRSPIVSPINGYDLEQLTTRERTFSLGPIGASGNATFLLTVPGNLPQGFNFYAQAEVLTASGPVHTNSLPIVLR